jgi:ABC-type antimicrobial peptide transport system permease subunit
MALGATRTSVLQMVLAEGVLLIALGLVLGLAGAFAFSRLLERFLYATRPTDPVAYAAVGGVLLLAALIASFAPARRATQVQPIVAFKTD